MIENNDKDNPIYLDPTQPTEKRVEDLISRMIDKFFSISLKN